eukprot:TRINITY_DN26410_c0_g1_i1.p1 TRINITY_DN26410_c0_g1~~TRINITY_DN26410_c0_g1_i1.p1  ORF type:complete len:233 (-),score=56.45 TRINITY_DN26410_c0_g1_i1:21-719(-)
MEMDGVVLLALIIGVLIVIITSVVLFGLSNKKRGDLILFLGPSGSGKTLMIYRLKTGKLVDTVISSQVTELNSITLHSDKSQNINRTLNIVDFPGHNRLRGQLKSYLERAKAIVFVLDSENFDVVSSSTFVYEVLRSNQVFNRVPFLIVCNKQDVTTTKISDIQKQIESNLTRLKDEGEGLGEIGGNKSSGFVQIGKKGSKFEFSQTPLIQFASSSTKNDDLSQVQSFLQKL